MTFTPSLMPRGHSAVETRRNHHEPAIDVWHSGSLGALGA
jgi:hypothetical protein